MNEHCDVESARPKDRTNAILPIMQVTELKCARDKTARGGSRFVRIRIPASGITPLELCYIARAILARITTVRSLYSRIVGQACKQASNAVGVRNGQSRKQRCCIALTISVIETREMFGIPRVYALIFETTLIPIWNSNAFSCKKSHLGFSFSTGS